MKKTIPIGIWILGILWILHGIITAFNALTLFITNAKLQGVAFVLLLLSLGWIAVGLGLIKGYALSRKIGLGAAGLVIILGIISFIIPPITQEEHKKQQYELYQQQQQYTLDMYGFKNEGGPPIVLSEAPKPTKAKLRLNQIRAFIGIVIALATISYLMSSGAKAYFGIKDQSFSLKL